nr:immunoglobulin heavy chain junction region [Macaca mulatta]MOX94341.1 immunoglobulin heavy chain junction region [Macaca mulatta]MOX94557.1 immunoglobulin heavy chain junction region [Macaca mulatta]MOX94889.1 immunoglobulin heavy chain junction region [Macaca mulatta]MOX95078.1 immunoglobulin heavy chain junction region [Macaca mulatta]
CARHEIGGVTLESW